MKIPVLILFFASSVSSITQVKDIIYVDFGFILSWEANYGFGLNYERVFNNHISFRTGLNVSIDMDGGPSAQTVFGLPVGFNIYTGGNNGIELGIGSGGMLWVAGSHSGKIAPGLLARIGYRYKKKNEEGKYFKAGLELPSNLYISLFGGGYGL